MLRTKIVCTLGPAADSEDTIRAFLEAGMAAARINFSHGSYEEHARRIELVRRLAGEVGRAVAILADLQGPKLRVGLLPEAGLDLREGETVNLVTLAAVPVLPVLAVTATEAVLRRPGSSSEGTASAAIPIPHPKVLRDVRRGDRILLDDGLLELQVLDNDGQQVHARVVAGGVLFSRKGLSLPHTSLRMPSVTDKDREDAAFAVKQGIDCFALSFVRRPEDVADLRSMLKDLGADLPIIAKIEKPEALDCLEEILAACDGLMVARGDLGIETPAEEVPIAQKRIIHACNLASKPVITATQMLDSMIRNPRPTRAEATDVANAILDGSDAVMLSGETAVGRYAVAAVQTMARIATATERSIPYGDWLHRASLAPSATVVDAIGQAACELAAELGARAIIASTVSGSTARRVASHRPATPILAPTPKPATYHQLALVWGVEPLLVGQFTDTDAMIVTAVEAARARGMVQDGDLVIITAGVPTGSTGATNLLKVHRVGEEMGWR